MLEVSLGLIFGYKHVLFTKQIVLYHVIGNSQSNHWVLDGVNFVNVNYSKQDELSFESDLYLERSFL